MSLLAHIADWGEATPEKIFVDFRAPSRSPITLTYGDLFATVTTTAAGLRSRGIGPGDHVGVLLPNCPEFLVTWWALNAIGAVMVPVSPQFKAPEIANILGHGGARTVVADPGVKARLDEATDRIPTPIEVVFIEPGGGMPELEGNSRAELPRQMPEDVVSILYTSGTSGLPKGCMHREAFYLHNAESYVQRIAVKADDVIASALPLFHATAQAAVACAVLQSGATMLLLDRFHPDSYLATLRDGGATLMYYMGVIPALLMLGDASPADRDHNLRLATGAGIPPRLHEAFEERFGVPCIEGYGMTEMGTVSLVDPEGDRRVGEACGGHPVGGVEVRLADAVEHGGSVGTGELQVRSPGRFIGYYRDDGATAAVMSDDGWFSTGDLIRIDERGFLFFVDRIKDIVRRSSENISALEVETVIGRHPAVDEVAVTAMPDPVRGEEARASVILHDPTADQQRIAEQLAEWVDRHLAYFKVPRYWEFRDSLPVTSTMKIRKSELRAEQPDPAQRCWDCAEQRWRRTAEVANA